MRTDLEVLTHDFRIQFINTDFVIYLDATTKAIVNSNLKFGFCSFLQGNQKKRCQWYELDVGQIQLKYFRSDIEIRFKYKTN